MERVIIYSLLVFCTFNSFSQTHSHADTVRLDGKLILYLSSDNYWQDGYSYGYLLGYRIKPFVENYLISVVMGGTEMYKTARSLYDQHFVTDQKYIDIARGMISGMKEAGINLYLSSLKDTLNYKDLLILNSVPDFTAFLPEWNGSAPGCSSLSSWGDATFDDAGLMGETVISRNLDWYTHPLLIENALVVVWKTRNPEKQSIVTFGYSGTFGALSGINESGVATFQNMGNHISYPSGTGFYPVNLAMRNGLEARDYNGDGILSPRDVTDAIRNHKFSSTYIIHNVGPSSNQPAAEILEIHNSFGHVIRSKADNPAFFGDNLAATNHFRKLKNPVACYRYSHIADSLLKSNKLGIQRNSNVLKATGNYLTVQTIQFNTDNNVIRFSFATRLVPAHLVKSSEINLKKLLQLNTLKLKGVAWLEGPYNPETGLMNTTLKNFGLLPKSQPYNVAPWNYAGTEIVSTIPDDVVDWVLLELREASGPEMAVPSTIVARRAAFLLNKGTIVDLDGNSPVDFGDVNAGNGNFLYPVIRHRNHLSLMAASAPVKKFEHYEYDFSIEHNVYGEASGYKVLDDKVLKVVGDLNNDGVISVLDYNQWTSSFGITGFRNADFNFDGSITVLDYNDWAVNFGKSSNKKIYSD